MDDAWSYLCTVHYIPITMAKKKLHKASRVMPKSELDSVARAKSTGRNRAFDVLWEAQQYWQAMETFRQDRERNKNYTYGRQWDDYICVVVVYHFPEIPG